VELIANLAKDALFGFLSRARRQRVALNCHNLVPRLNSGFGRR